MKASLLHLIVFAALFIGTEASSQEPRPEIPQRRRLTTPSDGQLPSVAPPDLAQTYRISLVITGLGDKKQECSLLTSTKQVKTNLLITGPVANVVPQATVNSGLVHKLELNGLLEETEGGKIRFLYSISTSVPIANTIQADGKGVTTTSISYTDERTSSALLATLGKTYDVLKVGDRTYSLKIEVEPEDKK